MRFLLSFICCLFLLSSFLNTFVSPTQHLCRPDQRDALLDFKTEFEIQNLTSVDSYVFSYPKTESWVNQSDCCSWDGITCDVKSGLVVGLDLSTSCLHGRLRFNSSLFRLRHLLELNLAYNNFTGSPIPTEFNKLEVLERLNLSWSSFSGKIPTELLQLTKLVSLDLSSFLEFFIYSSSPFTYPKNPLSVDESFLPRLTQNLRSLRELDLTYVNISSHIPHEFSNMWSLRLLRLMGCNLFGLFPSSVFLIPSLQSIILDNNQNLRGSLPVFRGDNSLQVLSLQSTSFSGTIPDSINNLKYLVSLNLYLSNFSGRIPSSLGNLSHLFLLVLSGNSFTGEIPSSIGNLKQLNFFGVNGNQLRGNFPSFLLNLTQLRIISLSRNEFTGFLPPDLSPLSKLERFYAADNFFMGAIPSSLFKISSLTHIDLSDNQFNDLPGIENVSSLLNLQVLGLVNNKFMVSPIDVSVFSPLKQLSGLALSGIPLSTGNITPGSGFSSQLEFLLLSDCNIIGFPEFLRNQRYLQTLSLSNNKIKGQVPDWLWRLPELQNVDLSNNSLSSFKRPLIALPASKIAILDVSSNAFQGPIFVPSRSISVFMGFKNNFSGQIPRSLCGLTSPLVLDISNNNLHGPIPYCLKAQMSFLTDLNLRNNSLNGSLPDIFMHATLLRSLDVSRNHLEGNLPPSLTGCSALQVLNVESNGINGMFPFQLSSLQNLQVLVLRSNKFRGMLHHSDGAWCGFPHLKIIDVSHNDFFGTLPSTFFMNWTMISSVIDNNTKVDYIGNANYTDYYTSLVLMSKGVSMWMERILTTYTAIDFSGNQLHGQIPDSIGLLKELRILNLSSNAFTGHIPPSLANLSNLESLDLSQNMISGEIPPQLGTLPSLSWINISHNQLVGSIPGGTQFHRQKCSSYEGNPGLNRQSLKDVCEDINSPTPPQLEPLETDEDDGWINWVAAGIGYAPGVVLGLTIGYLVHSHKYEWFMKIFSRNKH